MRTRARYAAIRFAGAAVCLTALVHRLFWGLGSQTIAGQNFFAYLTIQSNIAFAVVLVVAGVVALRRPDDPGWLTGVRAVVLSWVITAGLVFAILMWQAGLRGIPMTVPWSDVVLHFGLPVLAVITWIYGPGRRTARWRVIAWVIAFPIVWGVFTLWRGARIGWYPYYFLDLRQVSGLGEFCLTCAFALAVFAAVAASLIGISRWHETAPDDDVPDDDEPDDEGAPDEAVADEAAGAAYSSPVGAAAK